MGIDNTSNSGLPKVNLPKISTSVPSSKPQVGLPKSSGTDSFVSNSIDSLKNPMVDEVATYPLTSKAQSKLTKLTAVTEQVNSFSKAFGLSSKAADALKKASFKSIA